MAAKISSATKDKPERKREGARSGEVKWQRRSARSGRAAVGGSRPLKPVVPPRHAARAPPRRYNRKKGFGFITPAAGGDDIFFHQSGLNAGTAGEAEKVTFDTETDAEGKTKAVNVGGDGERKGRPAKKKTSAALDAVSP